MFNVQRSTYIDTHCHLDGEEFAQDRDEVVQRAREAGCTKIFLPAIDAKSCQTVLDTCAHYPDYCYPMLGLHPEEVKGDWREQLTEIKEKFKVQSSKFKVIAIGEIGLDYYWSREFEQEQLEAFEEQVKWAVELQLPLMIHCRKAQNELVAILKRYARELPGGVFHCFTGNEQEARQLLEFDNFVLGIGGVLTFKKSHLPEVALCWRLTHHIWHQCPSVVSAMSRPISVTSLRDCLKRMVSAKKRYASRQQPTWHTSSHKLFSNHLSDISLGITNDVNHTKAVEQLVSTRCHLLHIRRFHREVERGQAGSDSHIRNGFGHQLGAIVIVVKQSSSRCRRVGQRVVLLIWIGPSVKI